MTENELMHYRCADILTHQEYVTIKAGLTDKLERLDISISNLENTAKQYSDGIGMENPFLTAFRKYGTIPELTRPILLELVREIRIYDEDKIEIELNFRDEFARLEEYVEMNQKVIETA